MVTETSQVFEQDTAGFIWLDDSAQGEKETEEGPVQGEAPIFNLAEC